MTNVINKKDEKMSSIPNFVSQVQEIEKKQMSEWQSVQDCWKDIVAEGFRKGEMEPYMQNFQQYIMGEGINGYGLEQLLQQMEKHLTDMESLVGD